MTSIAVVAHQKKSLGGGLEELRELLADQGFTNPIWYEVDKSRKAPAMARQAVKDGADLLLLWGGDGTVQRCIDVLAGSNVAIGVLPAGTANLLASNLGLPMDLAGAVEVALHGGRRPLDVGVLNGERFAVMAGAGFDAALMQDANRALKDRFGRLAYVWSGARATRSKPVKMRIDLDGESWFDGPASCLLLGNFGTITGKLTVFANAEPDDGVLDVAVVTASRPIEWARVMTALAAGRADRSRFVRKGRGHRVTVKLNRPTAYELDGGARKATRRLEAAVEAGAITVCVAEADAAVSTATLVPETVDLSGDDAWTTLSRAGKRRLLKNAFQRMRVADGFSHARSMAFMTTLVAIQGVIGLVGLASLFDKGQIASTVVATIRRAVPGAAGQVLTSAVVQAHATAHEHRYGALIFGVVGCLVTGTTVMGQLERGLNRLYGVERDRPSVQKYGLALVFAISAGSMVAVAFACLAFGREILHTSNTALNTAWAIGRWPLGLALITVAVTLLFRWAPRRRQPRLSWLAFGSGVSVLLWAAVTVGLGVFYHISSSFGQTYGPLAGLIALLLWCLFSAMALLFGAAVVAQLESLRTGQAAPQDVEKVAESEPTADQRPLPATVS